MRHFGKHRPRGRSGFALGATFAKFAAFAKCATFAKFTIALSVVTLTAAPSMAIAQALPRDAVEAAQAVPGKAAIATAHPLATEAGREILAQGGNAFDAAVAVAAALAVVESNGSGLGGGGFFLIHRASDGRDIMIDAREEAPGAASHDMFLDAEGQPIKGLSKNSALAAGIPGQTAGMALLSQYGKLPFGKSVQPAIRIAKQGFPLYERLQNGIRFKKATFAKSPDTARIYLVDGEVPKLGHTIRQPELARTLELLAREGPGAFYEGAFARKLVAGVRKLGGNWTETDLAAYRAIEREPVVGTYRGARIVSASPPAAGGVPLIDALNILSGYELDRMDGATRKHLIVEAMRRAHRDRAVYLGDPDVVSMPIAMLTSPSYAAGQRTSIRLDRATPSEVLPGVTGTGAQGDHTTHFSILDAEGNRVAGTITLNLWFGSGLMIPGTGLLLNNQMDDFSIKPGVPNQYELVGGEANSIEPGKRMLSSSTPTFVESDRGLMILGTPGGSHITGMVLLATLDFLAGKSAAEIVGEPRLHHQYLPDVIEYEKGAFTEEERAALERAGHRLDASPRRWGNMQAVIWDRRTGTIEAAADPRGDGAGHVY